MDLTFIIDDAAIKERLQKLSKRLSDLEPIMNRIGVYYEEQVRKNFDAQASPDGAPWKKLSAATLMLKLAQPTGKKRKDGTKAPMGFLKTGALSKAGKGYLQNKKILIEEHDLMESIHSDPDRTSVTIGTGGQIKYAAIHQFGGLAGRKSKQFMMPARPYLALNRGKSLVLAEKDRRVILDLLDEALSEF